ncbi:GDSL esterase/lipase 1-like isoform X2 [Pistacia vera]|uniref:GDSL esterase/lipase 1-like isoform X2 n=1 Tax=Pistacia vera TaxID=55513 RepID=UPI0012633997|nr:GDSL esterase/lipase 1-like isoform X2 [Pistacia vera]
MARTSIKILCAIVLYAIAISSIGCYAAQSKKLLFVFGDSLFDPGNNQYIKNSAKPVSTSYPYGIDMNNKSTGRFSDGLIVPDYIAQFANLSVDPPYLQPGADLTSGANFASAAGGVLDVNNGVLNLKQQLAYFKNVANLMSQKVGAKEATKILSSSVYLFSFGGNDYFRYESSYPNATQSQRVAYMRMVVANLTNGLKEIYNMGGRKFAIQNVGPLGCLPVIKAVHPSTNGSCVTNFLKDASLHNKALSNQLSKMAKELSGFKYSNMDYFYNLLYRINNPTKYGFTEGKNACCGSGLYNGLNCGVGSYKLCSNPSDYLFFDGGHTSQKANRQIAELIWSGVPNVTGPYNVKQLFGLP